MQYMSSAMGWLDARHLQKLTCYSQHGTRARTGQELFEDDFQASPDGQVVPRLHRTNKFDRGQSSSNSTETAGAYPENLTDDQRQAIDAVLAFHSGLAREDIINLVHREDPWRSARAGVAVGERILSGVRTRRSAGRL